MTHIHDLRNQGVSVKKACMAFSLSPSTFYYWQRPVEQKQGSASRPTPARALSVAESTKVRDLLNSDRFADQSPRQIYATLLDEAVYHCSPSTMYRILGANNEVKERRNQLKHPTHWKPELLAERPNELWSWDITKMRSQQRLVYYYLYVILDVFSRYVVGWMIADHESAALAQTVISHSCREQKVRREQLTLHADRGGPMTAITTAQLLERLGVHKTHSRPYTPNDNPFSESQFKTMKYRPDYPSKFEDIDAAKTWARHFFDWYNNRHCHSSLALLTPAMVHNGETDTVVAQRTAVLQKAYEQHPERFVAGLPQHPRPPEKVWINPPKLIDNTEQDEIGLLQ